MPSSLPARIAHPGEVCEPLHLWGGEGEKGEKEKMGREGRGRFRGNNSAGEAAQAAAQLCVRGALGLWERFSQECWTL